MAAACCHLMNLQQEDYWANTDTHCSHVNVGAGSDISIAELAGLIARVTGFEGKIEFDSSMPDGTPRKLLDVSRLGRLGWKAAIGLEQGVEASYQWMIRHWEEISTGSAGEQAE